MVKKNYTITFNNGIFKGTSISKPSTALEPGRALGRILSEVVKLPTELIQLKIDTSKKDNTLLTEESAALKNQLSIIQNTIDILDKKEELQQKLEELNNVDDGSGSIN